MTNVTIYTDGACSGNPGGGGWGAMLMHGNRIKEISGFDPQTTNNIMELTAAIKALECLKKPCVVDLYSDSAYLVNGFNQSWIDNWQNNNWKTSQKKPVLNVDLWKRLVELSKIHKITWHKVKGHSDNVYNNRCDELARLQISSNQST